MGTRNFYRDLEPLPSFQEATNGGLHDSIPDDWWIVLTDVIGSTRAIEDGRYKDVNTVAAATIMAVINVDRSSEIPFIFGGDGASLAIPPHMLERVKGALLASQRMAKEGFSLDLRVAVMPAKDILVRGLRLGVCKYRLSSKINQASFSGFGWPWAESTMKDPVSGAEFVLKNDGLVNVEADFTGFECRWKPVKARLEFKLAIIVQSTAKTSDQHSQIYDEFLEQIEKIYGDVQHYHPLSESTLGLTMSLARLRGEAIVRSKSRTGLSYIFGAFILLGISVIGSLAFRFNLKLGGVRWGKYRNEVVENADFRKFDGSLKMVVDGTSSQEEKIRQYLEEQRLQGRLIYGLHRSSEAIMTCLVFTPGQDHAHFVDGSDGGYAIAAKMLKTQLLEFKKKS